MVKEALERVSVQQIAAHIERLQGVRHPLAAPEALQEAESYVRTALAAHGYSMSDHIFEDGGRSFNNVIATLSGKSLADERVLVVAHFDSVSTSPGADDNASGVAVLLELARVLSGLGFERTIQLVGMNLEEFSGENDTGVALRGSSAFANEAREKGWDIKGVIVLESVGFAGPSVVQIAPAGIPIAVPKTGDFIAVVGNEASAALVRGFCTGIEENGIPLPYFPLVVPGNGELLADTRRSDHASFWDHGYPAIMLTDTSNFRSPHYHGPSDTFETLNIPFIANVCRATAALTAELATPVQQ
jgi:Zn-dependent M28 family amino/carboxypeptidase